VKSRIKYLFPLITLVIFLVVYLFFKSSGIHEKELNLTMSNNDVFPVQVNNIDGTKFTGKVYGTLFGDKAFDCTEWEGQYLNSIPEGEFELYSSCNVLASIWYFDNGKFIKYSAR
jgi:hypothetical protein